MMTVSRIFGVGVAAVMAMSAMPAAAQTAAGEGTPYNFGPTFGNNGGITTGFTNSFTFIVTTAGLLTADLSNSSVDAAPTDIDFSSIILSGGTLGSPINFVKVVGEPNATVELWSIPMATQVGLGTYTLAVNGNARGTVASYAGNFNVVSAGAVPEPATWAMMMLGVGAVGAAMRRRKVTTRVAIA